MVGSVAIIIERADEALGGAERSMLEVARALLSRGVKVDLFAATGQAASGNIHILCPEARGKRVSLSVFGDALQRRLAASDYDVVHSVLPFTFADVYQPRGGTYAESILRNTASYRNPAVRVWKRVTAFANLRRGELLRAERRLCSGLGGPVIAALSHYVADQLRRHYGTDSGHIILTLNGVALGQHSNSDATTACRTDILSRLETRGSDRPVLLLFAAHNFRLKGLHPLIRAMQIACRTSTERPACLIVVGAGESRMYRALAERLGVAGRVTFLGSVRNIRDVLPTVDVGVLPTFYDPSSRFILEALAAGKPVITTRFNGATDLFTDGRHGKVIDSPDNVEALAGAICYFTSRANIDRATHAIAEDHLRANISIDRVADDLIRMYEAMRGGHDLLS